ncbi:hypothetical protein J4460_03715 [Candidatus Woesearchaeota archaeon]|nr:MAG: hypothetical protein QS99_C0009G0008 [archaeon GW2011_AR4]MBS3129756.1 hypothetical protein [Candidatus Woesearchaeota archaeon]HIH37448.1 hypothetical protein [Candidatus Woesearchaeota archaeon]HIH48202.1 hypothetical protein [Candidatus Woesearchaeota archaeon]HIJ02863.1 hypothetical protein [Candidatus Woesearchaeota archaeon]
MLSLKDIIEINKEFDKGTVINSSSLSFAVQECARSKNWVRSAALLVRAILIDHVFEEGNKRTAAAVIMVIMDISKIRYDPEKIPSVIITILKKNMTSVIAIERCIKDAIA